MTHDFFGKKLSAAGGGITSLQKRRQEIVDRLAVIEGALMPLKERLSAVTNASAENFLEVYHKKRRALYMGETNEYCCPCKHSAGSKREACTSELRDYVTKYEGRMNAITADRREIPIKIQALETEKADLASELKSVLAEIDSINAQRGTLAEQGTTAEAIEIQAQAQAQAVLNATQAEQQRKSGAAKTKNFVVIGVAILALAGLGFYAYKKLAK
jgi:regulator of protease activity HflC (stomatin/prohibitin superfamily)